MPSDQAEPHPTGQLIFRHALSTRLWHWISAVFALILLMSGLMIFNAHPRLYWGSYGANPDPAWLEIFAEEDRGYLRLGTRKLDTTGILGISPSVYGPDTKVAFPGWATLPGYYDLAEARRWHLSTAWFFALGTIFFGLWSIVNGHLRRDLTPRWTELRPRHLADECRRHLRWRHPPRTAEYNVLQKLVYLGVTAGLIPALILSGLTMSPWAVSVAPWLLDLFGGRQSARSVHFIAAALLLTFVAIHVAMVLLAGPVNHMRSMITGRFRLKAPER